MQTFVRMCYNKKHRNDFMLIFSFLFIGVILAVFLPVWFTQGSRVLIEAEGKTLGEYSLNEDRTIPIITSNGENIVVIRDGHIYMEWADCRDGLCMKQGSIFYQNESIICLPHKVIISVISGEEGEVDAGTY